MWNPLQSLIIHFLIDEKNSLQRLLLTFNTFLSALTLQWGVLRVTYVVVEIKLQHHILLQQLMHTWNVDPFCMFSPTTECLDHYIMNFTHKTLHCIGLVGFRSVCTECECVCVKLQKNWQQCCLWNVCGDSIYYLDKLGVCRGLPVTWLFAVGWHWCVWMWDSLAGNGNVTQTHARQSRACVCVTFSFSAGARTEFLVIH